MVSYSELGGFEHAWQFLREMVRLSRIKQEGRNEKKKVKEVIDGSELYDDRCWCYLLVLMNGLKKGGERWRS